MIIDDYESQDPEDRAERLDRIVELIKNQTATQYAVVALNNETGLVEYVLGANSREFIWTLERIIIKLHDYLDRYR